MLSLLQLEEFYHGQRCLEELLGKRSLQEQPQTAVAGNGYFIDTTSNVCNVTLPGGTLGDEVSLVDYAGTFDTNNLTVTPDTGEKIQGQAADTTMTVAIERAGFTLAYSGATQGWLLKDK